MTFPEYCIRRPVFTLVLALMLIVIGLIYFTKLPFRYLPAIEKPSVTVSTDYEGASPELIEKDVTIPLENALASIAGIDTIQSTSTLGKSRLVIDFQLGVDINEAASDIRNKLSGVQNSLPQDVHPPVVNKNDADANPVMMLGFYDPHKNALDITDYITRHIKPFLQQTPGVGEVVYHGAREYAVKIALDPVKMAAHFVTVAEIKKALHQQNIDIPSGQIKSKNRYYTVVTHARLDNAQHFADLVIAQRHHHLIRLRELATIKVGNQNEDNLLRINGRSAVGLAILAQSTANPVEVAHALKKTLQQLRPTFPPQFQTDIVFDSTQFIEQSLREIYWTFFEAALFVGIVVLLFLGNARAALIPIITIPICLIAAFWPMYWFGFELNTLTMLAMALAIGLVVDDAIVILENCHRHLQRGLSPFRAAIKGSNEILFAVIAMTITLAAVYAPMGFIHGFTGILFFQFGTTLALCVFISGLIALSLSPLMCSRFMQKTESSYSHWLNKQFDNLSERYINSLQFAFKKPHFFRLSLLFFMSIGLITYSHLGKELTPVEDQSYIISPIASPTNASTAYTDHYTRHVEKIYEDTPEKITYLASIKPASAFTLLKISPWDKRKRSQQDISQELSEKMQSITGINVFPVSPNPFGKQNNGQNQINIALLGNTSYLRLHTISNGLMKQLTEIPELHHIKNNLALDSEQIDIEINRQLAADLDVNLADVAELLSTMLGGSNPVNFNYNGQTYKVILQLTQRERGDISVLNKLYVKSGRDRMIPLSTIIQIKHSIGPDSLPHLHRLRTAIISAELSPGAYLNQTISKVQSILEKKLPEDTQYRFIGSAKDFLESSHNSFYALMLALLFIFLVLAAQFESFIDPLIILFSIPLCLVGALFSLWLSGQSLSIYSNLGMVTLIGLISKHGIMLTEFANQQIQTGSDKLSAILYSAKVRLRPILMTTLAMFLGSVPLALATGAGAESRRQLGIVMMGGMLLGTLFSLYVIPFAYLNLTKRKPSAD